MNEEFLSQLSKLKEANVTHIVVTMVRIRGSAPQELGARMIVGKEGLLFGTIGGGKVEMTAIISAQKLLALEQVHDFVEWNLQTDLGMSCGGVVSLFFEKIFAASIWEIAVFGAGHVAQELIRLLIKLDCNVSCIDPRSEWLDKLPEHFRLKKIQAEFQADEMKLVLKEFSPRTSIVSVTMGHVHDLVIVKEALAGFNFPYVGAIGSESKARVLKTNLKNSGISEEKISKVYCPIGLSLGNSSPVEVTISIVAQLISCRENDCKL